MARAFAKKLYNSKEWQKVRQLAIERQFGICACGKPIEEVHHIKWLNESNINDPEVTLNLKNLIGLCKDCHFKIHEQKSRKKNLTFDEEGNLIQM